MPSDERWSQVAKLQDALLEGKIDASMYEQLKADLPLTVPESRPASDRSPPGPAPPMGLSREVDDFPAATIPPDSQTDDNTAMAVRTEDQHIDIAFDALKMLLGAVGCLAFIGGLVLIIGNITGAFPSIPFAGYIVTTVAWGMIAAARSKSRLSTLRIRSMGSFILCLLIGAVFGLIFAVMLVESETFSLAGGAALVAAFACFFGACGGLTFAEAPRAKSVHH